jgi:hypothetical protein
MGVVSMRLAAQELLYVQPRVCGLQYVGVLLALEKYAPPSAKNRS